MATSIEVDELQQNVQFHQTEDVEALGRSYVCSMSSAISLEPPMNGNYGDFVLNIQRYLSRIVEELHLISAWSSGISHFQQPTNRLDDSSFTAMARLTVVTDMELLRRDVAKAQQELSQHCVTQMKHVQIETSTAVNKQEALYNELKQCLDDNKRVLAQQMQAIQALEKTHKERETQIRSIASTMRQVQQQTSTRFSGLEKALTAMTTAQFTHEQELQNFVRRLEGLETTHQLHLEASRRANEDSLAGLRAANTQLSSKMQVLRLEIQELNEKTQKRMQQLMQTVNAVASNASGKLVTTSLAPRRPSETPRPPTDCFIYAKAALPHRSSSSSSTTVKSPLASSRMISPKSTSDIKTQLSTDLLTVQQSVMSIPLGYEDTRPATPTEPSKDSSSATNRFDPLIPMKRGKQRSQSFRTS
ncbi:hypothetical protein P3T76_014396 [Phytophthora citrophthora]|uniref:Uncharacterized protein n=1 Tax=Phytophthora citrophthora TaxID=4793 RepID=A0AAD9G229_9STRA|nr:hypothetical protein P3T76_014396 [Phytophthora citrophthora]